MNINITDFISSVFAIGFCPTKQQFYIEAKDQNKEDSFVEVFLKFNGKIVLYLTQPIKDKEILLLGLVGFGFIIQSSSKNNLSSKPLKVTYQFNGKKKEKVFFSEIENAVVIGRSGECDLQIEINTFSRMQSTLTFDSELKEWFIEDGNKGKTSSNGTW